MISRIELSMTYITTSHLSKLIVIYLALLRLTAVLFACAGDSHRERHSQSAAENGYADPRSEADLLIICFFCCTNDHSIRWSDS